MYSSEQLEAALDSTVSCRKILHHSERMHQARHTLLESRDAVPAQGQGPRQVPPTSCLVPQEGALSYAVGRHMTVGLKLHDLAAPASITVSSIWGASPSNAGQGRHTAGGA